MNEMISIWLEQLYADEIEEVKGTISNERIWLKGSDTEDERIGHESNIEELEEYIEHLEELIAEINRG